MVDRAWLLSPGSRLEEIAHAIHHLAKSFIGSSHVSAGLDGQSRGMDRLRHVAFEGGKTRAVRVLGNLVFTRRPDAPPAKADPDVHHHRRMAVALEIIFDVAGWSEARPALVTPEVS